ncbi:MAG: class A beta-lactamase-related serine hydrolase [Ruminococcus sp.]|nr:class A beta-lactamase-related serine hydrolase [Ruminococcus sp.]
MVTFRKSVAAASAALLIAFSSVPFGTAAADFDYGDVAAVNEAYAETQSADAPFIYPSDLITPNPEPDPADSGSADNSSKVTVGNITAFKATEVTEEGYLLRWNTVTGADGYRLYVMKNGKPTLFKTTNKTGLRVKVKPGARNTFRVCAYKNNGSEKVEGGYLQKQFSSKPERVDGFSYKRTKRGGLYFSWEPVQYCTKYQLFYCTEKDGKYELFKEVSKDKTSVNTAMMPKGKMLYFKMRAVTVAKDMTAYGTCSKKLKTTVFNTMSVDEVMDSYTNSRTVKLVNAQGFTLSESNRQKLLTQLTCLGGDTGYVLYDIDSGAAICYNADQYFMPASSVKAPFMMYGLKKMDQGFSNLDTLVTYTSAQKHGGTGIIQNAAFGTQYTIRTLYQYIADYSDNVAYYMIQDHFGIDGYNKYIASLGCKTSLKTGVDRWGEVCATDAAREWDDIWTYLRSGKQAAFARKIYSSTCAANFRNQLGSKYTVYEKSGWTDGTNGYHNETALVRAEHPYIIICLSNRSSSQRMMDVAAVSENIHNEMWKYFK